MQGFCFTGTISFKEPLAAKKLLLNQYTGILWRRWKPFFCRGSLLHGSQLTILWDEMPRRTSCTWSQSALNNITSFPFHWNPLLKADNGLIAWRIVIYFDVFLLVDVDIQNWNFKFVFMGDMERSGTFWLNYFNRIQSENLSMTWCKNNLDHGI